LDCLNGWLTVRHQRACGNVPQREAVVQDGDGWWLHSITPQRTNEPATYRSHHVRNYCRNIICRTVLCRRVMRHTAAVRTR